MRGKLIKILERPKGYVNINEVYEMLDGVNKEEDCEYGDYGEVLSKWAICDYGEVLDAISCCDVVQVIPLDKIKQAREKIQDNSFVAYGEYDNPQSYYEVIEIADVLKILDKLIAESEGK